MASFESIQRVTVLGQGVMGPDIALNLAIAGYDVTGVDIVEPALLQAEKKTVQDCRQMVEGGILSEQESFNAQNRITRTLEWEESVSSADFIMEAVPEDLRTKQDVFSRCDALCSQGVVIASNTSSMSITRIAANMKHPERAVTAHWTIPAHLSPMVEIVCGEKTSEGTRHLVFELLRAAGKHPVSCQDTPGFIHNLLQFSLIKTALTLIEKEVASPEDVDSVVRNGFGLRLASVGPIQFLDMCGLDTVHNVFKYLYETTGDREYAPQDVVLEKVNRGELGVKSGKGFYDYEKPGSSDFWDATNRGIIRTFKAFEKTEGRSRG